MEEQKKDWRTMTIPEKAKAWDSLIRIICYGDSAEEAQRKVNEDEEWYRQSKNWKEHIQRYKQRYLKDYECEAECELWALNDYEEGDGYFCHLSAESFDNLMLNVETAQPKED